MENFDCKTIIQQGKGYDTELSYIILYDSEYFFKNNETIGENTFTIWESLEGDIIYSLPNNDNTVDIYVTIQSPAPLISGIQIQKYIYSEFYPLDPSYFIELQTDIITITANSENNGHVYQIGEEEYASNGLMWVQLGTPKSNWITI